MIKLKEDTGIILKGENMSYFSNLFHAHKWQEGSILLKVDYAPAHYNYEYTVRFCRTCGEKQMWLGSKWLPYDKDQAHAINVCHKAIDLITNFSKDNM